MWRSVQYRTVLQKNKYNTVRVLVRFSRRYRIYGVWAFGFQPHFPLLSLNLRYCTVRVHHKCYLFLHRLRAPPAVPHLLFCHAFAICHKMWPYRRDFDAANLSKTFKCKNEPCRTIFRG